MIDGKPGIAVRAADAGHIRQVARDPSAVPSARARNTWAARCGMVERRGEGLGALVS